MILRMLFGLRSHHTVIIQACNPGQKQPMRNKDGRNQAHRNITKSIPRKNHEDAPLMANAHPG
jgi:hypothetical protein